ncbi:hypothetical protein [Elongatibacter sediminis]|uniref:Uncharacterized protein n=1 Tax=Elongatibacter sediminis TaxID=3119006 RepID=A0AAW9RQ55_9GAMM
MHKCIFSILFLALLVLVPAGNAEARGAGPVQAWPISERYVLVADKSMPGLALVDLASSRAVERLVIDGFKIVGVATCPSCDFALASSGGPEFRIIRFRGPAGELVRETGSLDFSEATVERLVIATEDGELTDGRIVILAEGGDHAYIASSDDRAVYRTSFGEAPNAVAIISPDRHKPYGLNWGQDGNLLVSMHKRYVWRIRENGDRIGTYDLRAAGCPGLRELKPNLRATIDDPLNEGSILVLASNPKSYDAVVWRLSVDARGRQSCVNAASMIGRDSGWLDGAGEEIEFSRPHYLTLRPGIEPPQAIVTDIDNRALRLLDLTTMTSSSVMYNRDLRLLEHPPGRRTSRKSCHELGWKDAQPATNATGTPSCVSPVQPEALALNFEHARAHCESAGARLCEPGELRDAGFSADLPAWTRAACASCWMRDAGLRCEAGIETYRTPGRLHRHADFRHSWNSGQAVEVIVPSTGEAGTVCKAPDEDIAAAAPCCADSLAPRGQ